MTVIAFKRKWGLRQKPKMVVDCWINAGIQLTVEPCPVGFLVSFDGEVPQVCNTLRRADGMIARRLQRAHGS